MYTNLQLKDESGKEPHRKKMELFSVAREETFQWPVFEQYS